MSYSGPSSLGSKTSSSGTNTSQPVDVGPFAIKGKRFIEYMDMATPALTEALIVDGRLPQGAALQSTFTSAAQLEHHGWNREMDIEEKTNIDDMCSALGLSPMEASSALKYRYEQDPDAEFPVHGHYDGLYNAEDGLLASIESFSPRGQLKGSSQDSNPDLRPLERYADVAFLMYLSDADRRGVDVRKLRHVLRLSIEHEESRDAIKEVLKPKASGGRGLPGPGWRRGRKFKMDTPEAQVLMGTVHGSGVVWMTLRHRQSLGWKRIKSVVVFLEDFEKAQEMSLYFELADVDGTDE